MIESGAAAFLDRDPHAAKAILVALNGPGEVIGLERVADYLGGVEKKSAGEWRALSNVTGVAIPLADFIRVMRRSAELTEATLATLGQSLRSVTARLSASLQNPLEMRLAGLLSELGAIAVGNQWEPTANIGRFQQTQIAEMLGVSREHINRTLIMWEKSGLIFQTKAGDVIIENRKRLAQLSGARRTQAGAPAENEWVWEIEAHINLGLNAAAHDLAMEGVKRAPRDDRYKYLAVLSMARMGALREAVSQAENFKLTTDAADEDIASIGARLRRDLAFAAKDGPDKAQLKLAAEGYEKVFKKLKTTYPGVNAASTYAMCGDLERARKFAKEVGAKAAGALHELDADEPSYWPRATLAECRLVEGDVAGAAVDFAAAAACIDAAPGKIATTRRQLRRLKHALSLDDAWIDKTLPIGRVLFFSGPLVAAGGDSQQSLDRLKAKFSKFLATQEIVTAVGALAAGADIVMAETLLEAGVNVHVQLPLSPTEFLASSVVPAGADWRPRYIACVEKAQTIDWVRRARPSRSSYRLGARIGIGYAMRQAEQLATTPFGFFALQSGRTAKNSISHENAEIWRSLDLEDVTAEDDWAASGGANDPSDTEDYVAALVMQGTEAALKAVTDATDVQPLINARDLAIMAFGNPPEAFETARRVAGTKSGQALRLCLDVGVARYGTAGDDLMRSLLSAACRPQTPRGGIFATESFVHAATATPGDRPTFEYIGFAPVEEKLDPCPLYLTDI